MSNIKLFESKHVRSVWIEEEEKWYFSVQDVVQILTDTVDVKDYIKKIKKRDLHLNSNWGTICHLVGKEAADGKKRKIQAAIQKDCYELFNPSHHPKLSLLNYGWHKLVQIDWMKLKIQS